MSSSVWSSISSIWTWFTSCFFCGERGLAMLEGNTIFGGSRVTEYLMETGSVTELYFLCPRLCKVWTLWSSSSSIYCRSSGFAVEWATAAVNSLKYDGVRLWPQSGILASVDKNSKYLARWIGLAINNGLKQEIVVYVEIGSDYIITRLVGGWSSSCGRIHSNPMGQSTHTSSLALLLACTSNASHCIAKHSYSGAILRASVYIILHASANTRDTNTMLV